MTWPGGAPLTASATWPKTSSSWARIAWTYASRDSLATGSMVWTPARVQDAPDRAEATTGPILTPLRLPCQKKLPHPVFLPDREQGSPVGETLPAAQVVGFP